MNFEESVKSTTRMASFVETKKDATVISVLTQASNHESSIQNLSLQDKSKNHSQTTSPLGDVGAETIILPPSAPFPAPPPLVAP
jgi:hypothetical protein